MKKMKIRTKSPALIGKLRNPIAAPRGNPLSLPRGTRKASQVLTPRMKSPV